MKEPRIVGFSTRHGCATTDAARRAPHSGLIEMTLGNGKIERTCYNDRLQPTQIALGSVNVPSPPVNCPAPTTDLIRLDFDYGAADNNGNPRRQTIKGEGLPGPLTQIYGYDGVNRLGSVVEQDAGASPFWSRNYGYDAFGNRWISSADDPLRVAPPTNSAQFSAATNRLTLTQDGLGVAYDPAGNLIDHPHVGAMAYDAENRQTSFTGSAEKVGGRKL